MYSWFDLCLLLLDLERIIKSVSLQLSSQHHKSLLNTKTSSSWSLPSSCSWCGIPSQVSPPFYLKTLPDKVTKLPGNRSTMQQPGAMRRDSQLRPKARWTSRRGCCWTWRSTRLSTSQPALSGADQLRYIFHLHYFSSTSLLKIVRHGCHIFLFAAQQCLQWQDKQHPQKL